jgi:NADH-quinone oxidoreductase subunit N
VNVVVDFGALAPTAVLAAAAMIVLLAGVFTTNRAILVSLTLIGLFCALVGTLGAGARLAPNPAMMIVGDTFSTFFTVLIVVVAAVTVLLSIQYVAHHAVTAGDYYALLLFCCSGMSLVVSAADLVVVLLGIEILSIALYVLAGFSAGRAAGQEAAMKYFLLGAFALAFLIYGTALTFGVVHSTRFGEIAAALANRTPVSLLGNPVLLAGVGLILVGFAFKLSFAPFHMWTPDAYQGAPTPITAFMSVATKAAIFAALLRFLTFAVPGLRVEWTSVLWALAVLTMIVGNVAAVVQSSVKRMLAYSSIAQAGYILVGVVAGGIGQSSVMFYLLAYAFMNVGAFAVLLALDEMGESDPQIADLDGLTQRRPLLAVAMTVFMLSLAGIPLTAGFIAKLYVFTAAVRGGFAELAVIGMLTSAVATFYYLRIIVAMYMRPAAAGAVPLRVTGVLSAVIVVLVVATIALGVIPAGPLSLAAAASPLR